MDLEAFLAKEWYQFRQNLAILLLVLLVLPGATALGTAAYQHTIPEDVPIGIAPEGDEVTEREISVIQAGTAVYASPIRYESRAAATVALEREDVYLALVVPPGLHEEDRRVEVTLLSDQRLAPFQEPANYTQSLLESNLDRNLPADVRVTHERIGLQFTLSEYLVPPALMLILLLFSFVYFPLELHREREIFDRVDLISRIEAAVGAKIAFNAALLAVPLAMFQLVSLHLGYRIDHFRLDTILIIAVTFVYMAAVSGLIMFATKLRRVGFYLNIGVLVSVLAFSSFIYPVGFFSGIRKDIAVSLPTHHSMVMTRSTMMKETSLGAFSPRVELLVAFAAATVLLLRWSVGRYRRAR